MRHSTAHVMAEAVLDLFPGTKLGIGPAVADGFYYDFDLPAAPDARRPRGDRGRGCARASPRTTRSSARRSTFDDGRAAVEGQGQAFKVEILDDLAAKAKAAGEPRPPITFYEHGPFSDLCRGPHVALDGQDRAVQAAVRRGRVLARRREAPDAPADLRHGLARPGRSSTTSCGGARRRRSATTAGSASSSTCSASTTSARARRSGIPRAS